MASGPDIIVGIDIGMSYTKVAYAIGSNGTTRAVSNWPGSPNRQTPMVPTILEYGPSGSAGDPVDWGYRCDKGPNTYRNFKECFSSQKNEVRKLYLDFIRFVYGHIEQEVARYLPSPSAWKRAKVEYLFSVPANWSHAVSRNLVDIAKQAMDNGVAHSVCQTTLPEPVAAAVFTLSDRDERRNLEPCTNILFLDVGGQTADIYLANLKSKTDAKLTPDTVGPVSAADIGSVVIDDKFTTWLVTELGNVGCDFTDETFCQEAGENNRYMEELRKGKQGLGTEQSTFDVTVHGLAEGAASSKEGWHAPAQDTMSVPVERLQPLFDEQIDKVHSLVYECIRNMIKESKSRAERARREEKSHTLLETILLSGGLGGSRYFAEELQQRLKQDRHDKALTNIPNLRVCISGEPQLCVCSGLVVDRRQQLDRPQQLYSPFRRHVFFWEKKRYPCSYGVAIQSIAKPSGGPNPSEDMIWTVVWFAKKRRTIRDEEYRIKLRYVFENRGSEDRRVVFLLVASKGSKDSYMLHTGDGKAVAVQYAVQCDLGTVEPVYADEAKKPTGIHKVTQPVISFFQGKEEKAHDPRQEVHFDLLASVTEKDFGIKAVAHNCPDLPVERFKPYEKYAKNTCSVYLRD